MSPPEEMRRQRGTSPQRRANLQREGRPQRGVAPRTSGGSSGRPPGGSLPLPGSLPWGSQSWSFLAWGCPPRGLSLLGPASQRQAAGRNRRPRRPPSGPQPRLLGAALTAAPAAATPPRNRLRRPPAAAARRDARHACCARWATSASTRR